MRGRALGEGGGLGARHAEPFAHPPCRSRAKPAHTPLSCLPAALQCAPAGDELVATELIFGGVLAELEPQEAVALLSALVFQVGCGRGGVLALGCGCA